MSFIHSYKKEKPFINASMRDSKCHLGSLNFPLLSPSFCPIFHSLSSL